jgi:hypothetical protein
MRKHSVLKWTALLLVGPILGTTGAVLYEQDVSRDGAGLLAGMGWIIAAVVTAWFTVKVLRSLPLRYSVWAMIAAIPVGIVSVLMHGLVGWLTGGEEPFFLILAIYGAPLLLVAGFFAWVTGRDHNPPTTSQPGAL